MAWLFPLRTRVEGSRAIVVLAAPSHYVKRGLLAAFALPPLLLLLGFVLGGGALDGGPAGEVVFFACAALGGVGLVAGVGVAIAGPALSRRSRVRFDAERGVVVRERDGLSLPLRDVAGVVVRPRGGLAGTVELVVVRSDGVPLLTLHRPIAGTHTHLAQAIAHEVDAFFGVAPAAAPAPYRAPHAAPLQPPLPAPGALGMKPNVAAGFCYLPVQGIFILASVIALFAARDPFVRFAAKQSLLHLAFATLTGLVVIGGCGAALAVIPEASPIRVPGIVVTCLLVGAFGVWHLTAYVVACVRAFRGRVWVMPWLRWLLGEVGPPRRRALRVDEDVVRPVRDGSLGLGWVLLSACVLAPPACKPARPGVASIAMGMGHACARMTDGTVRCWGYNQQGQVGDGSTVNRLAPTVVPAMSGVVQLALAGSASCARKGDGTVACWGWNLTGQIGGAPTPEPRPAPAPVPGVEHAVEVSLGESHGCARLEDSTVRCWGQGGALGDGAASDRPTAVPVVDPDGDGPLRGVTGLALGSAHTCATMKDTTVRCWGWNSQGNLGDGTPEPQRLVPTPVRDLRGVKAIAAGSYTTCALLEDATVRCWGQNTQGVVGDGTLVERRLPTRVADLDHVVQIAVAMADACARIDDGTVRCWGSDGGPQRVDGLEGVVDLAVGWGAFCALRRDGAVLCWGANYDGALGDGTTEERDEPQEVRW